MTETTASTMETAQITDLHLEVRIAATTDAVWEALTANIDAWWPSPFYCGGGDNKTGRFVLEARPGGRMWEDWGDGDGLLWATVVNVVRGTRLEMVGTSGPEWGGPLTTFGTFKLEADGDATVLRYSESGFGRVSETATSEKTTGWRFLFDTMRAHLEGAEAPEWGGGGCSA